MVATMAHEFKAHEFTEAVLNATAPAAETGAASDTKNTSNGSQYTDAREGIRTLGRARKRKARTGKMRRTATAPRQ